jgi:2-haloacid dehalogenase
MENRPKTVVFDLGRVLVQWDPEGFYDRAIGVERRKALFQAVDLFGYNLRIDLGETPSAVMSEAAQAHPDFAADIMLWADRWIEMLPGDIPHSVRLLTALRAKGIRVVALTNFGRETLAMAEVRYPFLTQFDQRYVSAELGLVKPDPAIYQAVEAGTRCLPSDLIFADDTLENVTAAQKRGWHAHHFTDPAGWAAYLVDHGMLSPDEAA